MYAVLVLQLGYQPQYVLDEMQWYEVAAVMRYSFYCHKTSWEQARLIAATTAAPNLKESIKDYRDFLTFPWEAEKETTQGLTEQDKQRINELARYGSRLCSEAISPRQPQPSTQAGTGGTAGHD